MIARVLRPFTSRRAESAHNPLRWDGPRPSLDEAYEACTAIVKAGHETFFVATRLTPKPLRKHIRALYAFARLADDFADEPQFAGLHAKLLDGLEDELSRAFHNEATHPVLVALGDTAERFDLPIAPFQQLLTGFRVDLAPTRHATFTDLRSFLSLVAEPIGRVILLLYGERDPAVLRYGDELSAALALAHLCHDLGRDLARDRLYLPAEDLAHFGLSEETLQTARIRRRSTPEIRAFMRFQVARARSILERARPLLSEVRGGALEVAAFWHAAERLLSRIEKARFDVFSQRASLSGTDMSLVAARAALDVSRAQTKRLIARARRRGA